MKIRNGFVSNSSTTSFCIYGCEIDYDMYRKLDEDDTLQNLFKHMNVFAYSDYCYYIGREFMTIQDNETGKQFKETTEAAVEMILGEKHKLSTIEEAWRDG